MRVVGDAAREKAKKLSPVLIIPPPGLPYEYLETMEAMTISERRVAFISWPSGPRTLDEYTAVAQAALAALEAPQAHVLGHGTGAAIALALARATPARVSSLVLASPLAQLDDAVLSAREALSVSPLPLLTTAPGTTARACVDAVVPAARKSAAALTLREGIFPSLSELVANAPDAPLLLTRGSDDISSVKTAALLQQRVPAARVETFDGAGPLAHVDARSAYNQRVLDFFDEIDGVASRRAVMLPGSMAPGGSIKD
jgi:pimeloyl-ACP methyl ester carboxylesterase